MKRNEMQNCHLPPEVQRAYRELPERLYKARRASGLTQMQVEMKTYICKETISMYENGIRQPVFHNLVVLAALYGVSVGGLLGEK